MRVIVLALLLHAGKLGPIYAQCGIWVCNIIYFYLNCFARALIADQLPAVMNLQFFLQPVRP